MIYARRSFKYHPNVIHSLSSIRCGRFLAHVADPEMGAEFSRKKPKIGVSDNKLNNSDGICAAYCVDNPVVLFRVANFFRKLSFTVKQHECDDSKVIFRNQDVRVFDGDVVHVPFREASGTRGSFGHAFLFSSGAAVFWGLPVDMRKRLLDELANFQDVAHLSVKPLSRRSDSKLRLGMDEFDHEFKYSVQNSRKRPCFKNDEIVITDVEDVEQLLAFSYGLAQPVKLLLFEEVIDALVMRTRNLPDELARNGKIELSHRDIKGLIGELLAARPGGAAPGMRGTSGIEAALQNIRLAHRSHQRSA
ncbi:hypothetical protein FGB62_425g03 [Gracilaria domingensis]|nr:hypothetical protein FGB62_425g03 [Gracilaria domingensis]